MRVVVQKFGGTCVEFPHSAELSAERIMEMKDQGVCPVAVISAMGREGQPYSTPDLVNFVREISPRIEPRELDLLMSCGEIIATVAMANLLKAKGYDTVALSGGQAGLMTDLYYGQARIIDIQPKHMLNALAEGRVVFVAGFQGVTQDEHAITTLGEGGSDYTAVALAVTFGQIESTPFGEPLSVEPLEIYKEVDGVLTGNPKSFVGDDGKPLGEAPRLLQTLTYDELVEMAKLGAQVLQHKASVMARQYRVPVVVKNFMTNVIGTRVSPDTDRPSGRRVSGTADLTKLIVFDVVSDNPRLGRQLGETLAMNRLNSYEVSADVGHVRFAVKSEKYRDVPAMLDHVFYDRGLEAKISEDDWALLSLVGEGIRGGVGALHDDADAALKAAGIETFGEIEGALSLSYLVREEDRRPALVKLHEEFVLK